MTHDNSTEHPRPGADAAAEPAWPHGVVFDCDGTIADTEAIAEHAWTVVLGRYGYQTTRDDFAATVGRHSQHTYDHYASRVDLPDDAVFRPELRREYWEAFDRGCEVFDDAVSAMHALHQRGVPLAVASSSRHDHVDRVLEVAGVARLVTVVIGADDCDRWKPDPEPYLRAATALGLEPARCAAVEDSAAGIAAAKAAGMRTVAVVRRHHTRDSLGHADLIVDRLEEDHLRLS